MHRFVSQFFIVCALLALGSTTSAAAMLECRFTYDLKGWSAVFKTARGTGEINCSNGQSASVDIVTYGGGVTFGTSTVVGGKGHFSQVEKISDLYGTYVEAMAHAGAGGSTDARAMFKGSVRLSLAGRGQGFNVGFAFGSFRIKPR